MVNPLQPQQFEQQQLDLGGVPVKQPHQMGVMEFAQHPKTMFHGSDEQDFERLREARDDRMIDLEMEGVYDQGFHFGTAKSAIDRLRQRHLPDRQGFLHPLWHDERGMQNTPEHPYQDEGVDWTEASHYSYYANEQEHPGSISAIVGSPDDVQTHGDFVKQALDRGGIPSGEAEWFHQNHEFGKHLPGGMKPPFQNRGIRRSGVVANPTGMVDEIPPSNETGFPGGSSERYRLDRYQPTPWGFTPEQMTLKYRKP